MFQTWSTHTEYGRPGLPPVPVSRCLILHFKFLMDHDISSGNHLKYLDHSLAYPAPSSSLRDTYETTRVHQIYAATKCVFSAVLYNTLTIQDVYTYTSTRVLSTRGVDRLIILRVTT